MNRSASEWNDVLVQCGVKPTTAAIWSTVFEAHANESAFSAADRDLTAFLGQVLHESDMLEHLEENLSYSAERLCAVWPSRFPALDAARPYARNPEALANKVYAARLGNVQQGDGWRFRGRGLIQVTGRANYETVETLTGLPVVGNPALLAQPAAALRASIAWWEANIPDAILSDPLRVTRAVNGGTTGLAHRTNLTDLARDALA